MEPAGAPAFRLRDVLDRQRQGDRVMYDRLVSLLRLPATAGNAAVLGQLLDQCDDALDRLASGHFAEFATALLELDWFAMSAGCVRRHGELLSSLAAATGVRLVRALVGRLVANFLPHYDDASDSFSPDAGHVQLVSKVTHGLLHDIVANFPLVWPHVPESFAGRFPAATLPTLVFRHYFDQLAMFQFCCHVKDLRSATFDLLVEKLGELELWAKQEGEQMAAVGSRGTLDMFAMQGGDEETRQRRLAAVRRTLDCCGRDLLTMVDNVATGVIDYGGAEGDCGESAPGTSSCSAEGDDDDNDGDESSAKRLGGLHALFEDTLAAFECRVLPSAACRLPAYFWFYLCSFDQTLLNAHCAHLWHRATGVSDMRPVGVRRPAEGTYDGTLVAQCATAPTAVCYLACLLARHRAVDLTTLLHWLDELVAFAHRYQASVEVVNNADEGLPKHGLYYSVCHAVFMLLSHRSAELFSRRNAKHSARVVQNYRLEQIAHHALNPLRYAHPAVVKCFASLCRCMQLVYCMGQIQRNRTTRRPFAADPFDVLFVYEPCDEHCPLTWSQLRPLHRPAATADVTAETLAGEHRWNTRVRMISGCEEADTECADGGYDYLSHSVDKVDCAAAMDVLHAGDEDAMVAAMLTC